jgi:alpha-glucosidase
VDHLWWKHGVIYQIYPRSFQDSNGDGVGDLQGVIDRLDYLNDGTERSLGIDAIWFSPTYPSPMADFGYDVSDYEDVHPEFGDLKTMQTLIDEAHKRGIRVVLDFVPNHTSSEHPWFLESRASTDNAKRDWYVWRDPGPAGEAPNNWLAVFGGQAWEWDQKTQQYYMHAFLIEQPDLNWRNPEVEQRMHDVLRFWMDRGVDGFRIDVMDRILKDPQLRDNPPEPNRRFAAIAGQSALQKHVYDQNWHEIIDAVIRIRTVLDEYPERMAVGEVSGTPEQIAHYYGKDDQPGLHLAFNFPLTRIWNERWQAQRVRRYVDEFEAALPEGAWPNYVTGNHDVDRFISRVNHDGRGQERARAAAVLLMTLRGTPFVYYGEEIGMENVRVPEHQLQDPARIYGHGRDPERTPMQWTASGAFTTGTPWLPYGNLDINVERQLDDPGSMLTLYRRLIWFRKKSQALRDGDYAAIDGLPDPIFAYMRTLGSDRLLAVLNFAAEDVTFKLPANVRAAETLIGTHGEPAASQKLTLAANEARLIRLA